MTDHLEDALRHKLRGMGADIDAASDLEQRIARKRAARKLRRSHQKIGAATGALVAAIAATVLVVMWPGGHSQQVTTAVPTLSGPPSTGLAGSGPATGDVSAGKFTRTVTLDDGAVTITPAPPNLQPQIPQTQAQVLVGSDSQVYMRGWTGAIGFAEVSINPKLASEVNHTPAWVAVIKQEAPFCPNTVSPSTPATTAPTPSWPPGYLAVIVTGNGTKVLDYHSRSQVCDFPAKGPSVSDATQLVSIPWQLVSLQGQTLTFRYHKPACDPYAAGMSRPSLYVGGNAKTGQWSLETFVEAPYTLTYHDLLNCGGSWATATTRIGPIPGAPGAPMPAVNVVNHAPTGPVGATT
ncbi:MAG: hypothetical protein KGQ66_01375 [Acidobacteriota bacterium]|nr:hypothetical protein [Acidobacteriota bacterium]